MSVNDCEINIETRCHEGFNFATINTQVNEDHWDITYIIDLGAQITTINKNYIVDSKIKPINKIIIHTPTGSEERLIYEIIFYFPVEGIDKQVKLLCIKGDNSIIGNNFLRKCELRMRFGEIVELKYYD
jgi:hypothetical protein